MQRSAGREGGFSILEVVIAAGILAVAMALATGALTTSQRAAGESASRHAVESAVTGAISVLVPELRQSGASQVVIEASTSGRAGNTNQQIRFRRSIGFDVATESVQWSPEVRYFYEAAGGRLRRQEPSGTGAITTVAAGLDDALAFTIASGEVTIAIQATRVLTTNKSNRAEDRFTVSHAVNERVTLRN